jgi:predicted phage baseplate assembly protein
MSAANTDPVGNAADCGCCTGTARQTPANVSNRPGLSGVAYRVGTQPRFKQSLLTSLSASAGLKTRQDDDFSIALADAWAVVADVLTFYQERIANESYVRTATERRSLLELSRLIGYEPGPGVAATGYLAFTLESAPGAPAQAAAPITIDVGTRLQSIPGPGEKPQTFETVEKITARVECNAIRPRMHERHPIPLPDDPDRLYLQGTATNLQPGDTLLITPDDSSKPVQFQRIVEVVPDATRQRTSVRVSSIQAVPPAPPRFTLWARIIRVAPRARHATLGTRLMSQLTATAEDDAPEDTAQRLERLRPFSIASNRSAGVSTALTPLSTTMAESVSSIARAKAPVVLRAAQFTGVGRIIGFQPKAIFKNLVTTRPPPPGVMAMRVRASLFGHNVPDFRSMPDNVRASNGGTGSADWPAPTDDAINLDTVHKQIVAGSWAVVQWPGALPDALTVAKVASVVETGAVGYTLSAKVTRIGVQAVSGQEKTAPSTMDDLRKATVFAQSEAIPLAPLPIEDPVAGARIDLETWVDGLTEGQTIIVCGELALSAGNEACECATIAAVEHVMEADGYSRILLATALRQAYVRASVTIYANVACATHGETVNEAIGSGDPSQPYQRFVLRHSPLTYVSSPSPSGAESTLEVRVNDLEWHEVPSFVGCGPTDRVYTTRRGDDGLTAVQFGDGRTGACPPTGAENVRATYRKGIGLDGNVDAGKLTLLLTRPLGVRSVSNPLPATGGAEADNADDIRRNAPLAIMTLDRVVSLQDYEDFARAFAGIAKARADWAWNGQTRGVLITVAGPFGADIDDESAIHSNLVAAIQQSGDALVPVRLLSYRLALFQLSATITVDPDYAIGAVLGAVERALRIQFGFDVRDFAQGTALSEVTAVAHAVVGVVGVHITQLERLDGVGGEGLLALLPAAASQIRADGTSLAAELLTLDPGPIQLAGVRP